VVLQEQVPQNNHEKVKSGAGFTAMREQVPQDNREKVKSDVGFTAMSCFLCEA
ncbi:unnamed protein product, partial [Symbiodinium sp. CCMP2592]